MAKPTAAADGPKSRCSSFGALKAVAIDRDILVIDSKIQNIQEAELAAAARHPFNNHTGTVFSTSFSPDASFLATSGKDGVISIVEIESGAVRAALKGHSNVVFTIQFSPDGRTLASGSRDGFVLLWDLNKMTRKAALKGHTSDVLSVAFSPNCELFASGSFDQTILLWNMKKGTCLRTLKLHTSAVNCVIFSPTSDILASASDDGTVCLFECAAAANGTLPEAVDQLPPSSPAASHLNPKAGGPTPEPKIPQFFQQPGVRATLRGHTAEVNSFTFFPNGSIGASCSDDKKIILWDMTTYHATRVLQQSQVPVLSLAFSPDQYLLASANKDGSIGLYDLVHDYKYHKLVAAGHKDKAWGLSWSLDSSMLASSSGDPEAQVIIWDICRGHRKQILQGGHSTVITGAKFLDLPDAPFRLILETTSAGPPGGPNQVCTWDAESGQQTSVQQVLEAERRKRDEMLRKSREDQIRRGVEVDELRATIPTLISRIEALETVAAERAAQLEEERKLRAMEQERHEAMLRHVYEHLGIYAQWLPKVEIPVVVAAAAAAEGDKKLEGGAGAAHAAPSGKKQ